VKAPPILILDLTELGRCKKIRFKKGEIDRERGGEGGMQKTTPNSRPQKGDTAPVPY